MFNLSWHWWQFWRAGQSCMHKYSIICLAFGSWLSYASQSVWTFYGVLWTLCGLSNPPYSVVYCTIYWVYSEVYLTLSDSCVYMWLILTESDRSIDFRLKTARLLISTTILHIILYYKSTTLLQSFDCYTLQSYVVLLGSPCPVYANLTNNFNNLTSSLTEGSISSKQFVISQESFQTNLRNFS